jgi:hypothetical protein
MITQEDMFFENKKCHECKKEAVVYYQYGQPHAFVSTAIGKFYCDKHWFLVKKEGGGLL